MSRSNELAASSAPGPGTQSRAHIPHPKDLRDPRSKLPHRDVAHLKSNNPLSADEIDEQIRWFFAQDLA
jgi:hypothetical protein